MNYKIVGEDKGGSDGVTVDRPKDFFPLKQKNARSYFSRNFTSTFVQSIFLLTCDDTFTKSCSKNFKTRFERNLVTLFYRRAGRAMTNLAN